ncbi:MAG: vWA domain-containing protein [Hyphomicrobiaceae bacterium]
MLEHRSPRCRPPNKLLASFSAMLVFSWSLGSSTTWACRENAMIVFDASGSMARHRDGQSKIDIARRAVADILPTVTKYRPTGLVTYGGIDGPECRDVAVRVEPEAGSGNRIILALQRIPPLGPTALTASVRTAAEVLSRLDAPGVIVLITDGRESCGGNACALAHRFRESGRRIRVHVVSFFFEGPKADALKCLTEVTGGTHVSTNSLESLRDALRKLLSCRLVSKLPLRSK